MPSADETFEIPCSIIRGGTSRAVFFSSADLLRYDRPVVERLLLNIFGSPDAKQTNGLGGATSQTSKAAIIGPASRSDADVDYTFAQVSVATPVVDWGGNCGNISSAVGAYAVNAGLVEPDGERAVVRIHNTSTASTGFPAPVRGSTWRSRIRPARTAAACCRPVGRWRR